MCGLVGIVSKKTIDLSPYITKAINNISHRGPDAKGYHFEDNLAFGHSRLSIIDINERSNQPMKDYDNNYVIIFNGEIYNYEEIKNEIKNQYNFCTGSDTEVLLAGYIVFGEKILNKLNGCFSFAIFNKESREVFIARDRLVIKPLYYHLSNNYFLISSEIRSIISTGLINKEIDVNGVNQLVRYQSSIAPTTIIKNVKVLMPGHYMNFNLNDFNIKIRKFWGMDFKREKGFKKHLDVKKEIYKKLTKAVERRMISDVDIAAFLSGGIDSSIIVSCMSKLNSGKPINTFSLVHNDQAFDESQYSDIIADIYNTNHYKVKVNNDELLSDVFEALKSFDSPSADGLNSYIVSKKISELGIKVALSGLGGDELFGGYPTFKYWYFYKKFSNYINPAMKKIISFINPNINSENIKLFKMSSLLHTENKNSENINEIFRNVSGKFGDLIFNEISNSNPNINHNNDQNFSNYLYSSFSISEINRYTSNVLLKDTDQMSMSHGLEVRVPFFDHELVEYVLSLKDELKYHKYQKQLLVDAFDKYIPSQIYKRKKQGFILPINNWMQKELYDFCSEHIMKICDNKLFNAEQVKILWDVFNKKKIYGSVLWSLIVFNNWVENNFDI